MWIIFAFGSAVFAGLTAILAKIGMKHTDSTVATAVRTIVVLALSWGMVGMVGSAGALEGLSSRTILFLVLSGLATGASWLCYFRALQLGTVSQVTPVDKSSTILSMLLAFIFLHEPLNGTKVLGMALIAGGTALMIHREKEAAKIGKWLFYAALSAVFAALTSILGKVGIEGVESNLGTAIRTCVVLVMAWLMVFVSGKQRQVREIPRGDWIYLGLSGLTTGGSWLCYYRALQEGPASIVVPIDKLSVVFTVGFSWLILKERLERRALAGLALLTAGTLVLLI